METFVSKTSGITYPISERIAGLLISPSILNLIRKEFPDFKETDFMSMQELAIFREKYMVEFLHKEMGELNSLEKKVLDSLNEKTSLTDIAEESLVPVDLTYGQRLADKVASFGGSWTFIIYFGVFILIWIIINIIKDLSSAFNP